MRVSLTGGISFKSLRATDSNICVSGPDHDGLLETWPVEDLAHDIYSREFDTDFDILANSLQLLSESAAAAALVNEAGNAGWEIGLTGLERGDFHIDVPERKIILSNHGMNARALARAPFFRHAVLFAALRALRDVWHEKRHGGFDTKFGPEGILMLERARAADCESYAVLCAWELRIKGYGEIWRHALASNEGDMARAFSDTLEKNAMKYSAQDALAASFRQWYVSEERSDSCDHETLEYMDDLLRACPAGRAFGMGKPSAMDVEVLSCLPDRTAYLRRCGDEILSAPLFAGLHDEVNQSHFLQIMHDARAVFTQGIAFRDGRLAAKIFPNGEFTPEGETVSGFSEKL